MRRLVVVCGPPGVGKTTVARHVADRLDARLLRTDAVRKELYDDPDYGASESARVYATVLARAGDGLEAGEAVVLDGTFRRHDRRDEAAGVADAAGVPLDLVRVVCDPAVVRERVADREGLSDAGVAVAEELREAFDPPDRDHHTVDNSGDLEAVRRQVAALYGDGRT